MKTVTLRRVAKIRNRLETRLQELARELHSVQGSVNVYDKNISAQLVASEKNFNETLARYTAVSSVVTELRIRIAKENARSGINDLLTHKSSLQGQLARYSVIAGVEPRLTDEQISARVEGLTNRLNSAASGYYIEDTLSLTFVSKETIEAAQKSAHDIQVKLDEIQDELEHINSTVTVEILDTELSVLQSEKIAV